MGLFHDRKGKGEIEMAEGVGNPVYDSFNEGQPLEDVSDVSDANARNANLSFICLKTYAVVTGHKAWAGNELHQVESWQ